MAGQRFGGVLRARREQLQMTQEELAHRAALAVRTIRNLEAGRIRRPRGHSVRRIADALLPVQYTPHDFRRIWATDAVSGGLPVHIATKLLGHAELSATQIYVAVYQDDVIRHHRAFIARRRALRPSSEYREPTTEEWAEFAQHFAKRKVGLGTCMRPYGSDCQHEHACIRCPLLRPDPTQEPRLLAIIVNLNDRVREAQDRGWVGEIDGLKVSLDAANQKLAQMRKIRAQHKTVQLPVLTTRTPRPRAGG